MSYQLSHIISESHWDFGPFFGKVLYVRLVKFWERATSGHYWLLYNKQYGGVGDGRTDVTGWNQRHFGSIE